MLLEAPVFNLKAALEAAEYGVNRIELCANFPEGGETPSAGMLKMLKAEIDIPIFCMVRPRGGNFYYSDKEIGVMKDDIKILRDYGADGFVFGALDAQGNVNRNACETLLRAASGLPCTFHRAFDACRDQGESLETLINLGFMRILSSGGKNTVSEGRVQLLKLLKEAEDRIIIMPGGGTEKRHIAELNVDGRLKEIHASCKELKKNQCEYINPDVSFSDDPKNFSHYLGVNHKMVEEFLKEMNG